MYARADVITAYVSGNSRIDVALNNTIPYVAFQMDFTLPAGCSLAAQVVESKRLGKDMAWPTATWADNSAQESRHKVYCRQIDTGRNVWRLVGYSLDNHIIDGLSSLNLFTLSVDGSTTDLQGGLSVHNVKFVNTDMEEHALSASIEPLPTFGDVNQDGRVDILDVIAITDLQTGGTHTAYRPYAADVDRDGAIEADDAENVAKGL